LEIDHKKIIERVIELSGGKQSLNEEMENELAAINKKWNQDVNTIGRILRAHLFVEYFVTECLKAYNPKLGNLQNARLTFSQKLSLIENYSKEIKELSVGIKRLNKIRNLLAHRLEAKVTDQDKEVLLSVNSFKYLREALAAPSTPSEDNLDILEDFAKHVGAWLVAIADTNSLSRRFSQAMTELQR
jgi:hypothetical protein